MKLHSLNNYADVIRHISNHKNKGRGFEHELAKNFQNRLDFLETTEWLESWRSETDMDVIMSDFNTQSSTSPSLDMYLPTRETEKFIGKCRAIGLTRL